MDIDQGSTGITNSYGIKVKEQSGAADNWNIHSVGATSRNFFEGSVGIGISSPGSYKLNVDGKIRADEIVVNTTGADFVFEGKCLFTLQIYRDRLQPKPRKVGCASPV